MSIETKRKMPNKLGYFDDSGTDTKKLELISAAYYDRTEIALKLIDIDPDQINRQDPHSGLTAAHIAIFRQNKVLVTKLVEHPQTNWQLKDAFNRRPVDMLDYTVDEEIFQAVTRATYPDSIRELESMGEFSDEPQTDNSVVPFKPKPR